MSFLNPLALWALAGIIPLAAVYLLKIKPRRQPTTALFLWQQILTQRKSTTLFQRLRHLLSLLLMLLAFVGMVMMMARPQFGEQSRQDLLIVIDHSGSMNSIDHGKTRLELAKTKARDMVQALNGRQRAAIAVMDHELVYLCHLTDDTRKLTDAIDTITPGYVAVGNSALKQIGQQPSWARQHRVIVLSDGCFDAQHWPTDNQRVELHRIGKPLENIGIIVSDLRRLVGVTPTLGLYVQLASTYDKDVDVQLALRYLENGLKEPSRLIKVVPMTIKPGINEGQVLQISQSLAGQWTLVMDLDDALIEDNTTYMVVKEPVPVKVGVSAQPRFFFQHAVEAFAGSDGLMQLSQTTNAQVVLASESVPDAPKSLVFAPRGESHWWQSVGQPLDALIPKVELEDHHAMRYLDMAAMQFAGARMVTLPQGAVVWVKTDRGVPLVWQMQHGEQNAIVINMDPSAESFYLSPYFPVMIESFATYLVGREDTPPSTYRAGQRVILDQTSQTQSHPLTTLGFVTVADDVPQVGCSLLSEADTLVSDMTLKDSGQPVAQGQAPAYWFGIFALCLLAGESLLYHRRKVD